MRAMVDCGSSRRCCYGYDPHGNMLHMPHLQQMRWDYKDQLRQVDLGGGGAAYYVYDASGQRVRKVCEKAPGLTEERIYLGGFEIFRRHGGAIGANTATLERETLHIMDDKQRIALVETRTLDTAGNDPAPAQLIRYQFGNHLGSASLELDDQAQIISYEEYTPYGSSSYQAARSQTETAKRYRYTGKERDEESGLYYHGARYYAAWLGKWISADSIGIADDLNLYTYARCNPVVRVDPDGNFSKKTYDDWLNKEIKSSEGKVKTTSEALNSLNEEKKVAETRLEKIGAEIGGIEKQREEIVAKRKPLESKKTKRTDKEEKDLNALKNANNLLVKTKTSLTAEEGKLKSKVIRLNEQIKGKTAALNNAAGNLHAVKKLKNDFDAAYTDATAKLPKADVELLTDIVMNEARDTSPTAKKAIAYAYTNDTVRHMKGGHVASPPKDGAGEISHFSDDATEIRFEKSIDKAAYIGQIVDSLGASRERLADSKNTGDPTSGATNWVSPDAPGMKTKYPPDGLPSWTKSMTKIIVTGVPAGQFTFFK